MPTPELTSPHAQKMFAFVEQYLASSGLTQKAFCQKNGLALSTFELWLSRYRQNKKALTKPSIRSPKKNSFVPLTVKPPESAEVPPARYVIEYPNGVVVRLSGAVAPQMLVHLIQTAGG